MWTQPYPDCQGSFPGWRGWLLSRWLLNLAQLFWRPSYPFLVARPYQMPKGPRTPTGRAFDPEHSEFEPGQHGRFQPQTASLLGSDRPADGRNGPTDSIEIA